MRAARAFLRWTANDLAKAANVGVMTVRRAESEDGVPKNMLVNNIDAIRRALESAGVEFSNGDAPSVQLTKAKAARKR